MFPNVTSLAQREQKRQEILEIAQRRVRQSNTKRQMYAGTSWACNITNGITTVSKKSTESTQTDMIVGSDETIPKEVKQTMENVNNGDAGVQANPPPSVVDAGVSAKPSVVDVGISNTPIKNDSMNGEDTPEKYIVSEDEIDETKDQKRSKQAVAEIFDVYPVLGDLRIHPVNANGRQLTKYYVGREAMTYSIRLNKVVLVPSINWSETYDYIGVIITNDVRFLTYINEKRERNEMGKEDRNTPQQIWQYIGSKTKRVNASKGDLADHTKQRLEDSFLFDNSSSTTSDQTDSKLILFWTISENKGLLESNGLRKKIVTILNGAIKTSPIDNDGYVWVDGNLINVYGKESNRIKPAITKKVNWVLSLRSFINMVRDRGLELEVIGKNEEEIDAKDFAQGMAKRSMEQ
ncbi:unnamed protein product [Phytophthora lilii]|uniref:Unnamed protein product n=1 Tax=Phytophthora lilii TaxID=2077276 RepID=A0A9W6WYK5_9STRA|nr:unnamed protein product [Phytophthora lilii]